MINNYTQLSVSQRLILTFALCVTTALLNSNAVYALPSFDSEPNNTNATAQPLYSGQFGQGSITSSAEFDGWVVQNVRTDQFVCAFLSALESTPGSADPVLSAYFNSSLSDTANSDIYNDDGGPPAEGFNDSFFCGERIKRSGSVFFRVDGFGSSILDSYKLFQIVFSPNEVLPEIESNDTAASAMPIKSPAILGTLSSDFDFYSFHAEAGESIVVMLDSDPTRPHPAGSPLFVVDAEIRVFDSDGTSDLSNSVPGEHLLDTHVGPTSRAFGVLPAPHTGTFFVRVAKNGGIDGNYRLIVLVDGDPPVSGACFFGTSCVIESAANCRGKFGGPNTTCVGDTDSDVLPNAVDNCPTVANALQEDLDGDEVGDACDTCPNDQLKIQPGACGCGTTDVDSDGDGVANCNDQCPASPNESVPGACGCGVVEVDSNGNGTFDCLAGPELKALLRSLLAKVNSLKGTPSKGQVKSIKGLLTQAQGIANVGSAQIAVTQPGFNIKTQVTALGKATNKVLKSSGSTLAANKKSASKLLQKLIAAIA